MCVLASAVDIFSSHPYEAVTGYPAGHRLFFVYTPCVVDLACGEMSILLVDL